jgi:hypothetical protein
MASYRTYVEGESQLREPDLDGAADPMAVMGAVREDIRQTLRAGWIDPGIEATAAHPVFLTTAWSAIRPNVGKSFLVLSRALRTAAEQAVQAAAQNLDLSRRLDGQFTDEERLRIEQCVKAAHLATPKAQIVIHALHRAARRDALTGTGREEAPVRRGVPEWQRWMSFQPASEVARPILEEAAGRLDVPPSSPPLRLLARWPQALNTLWQELEPVCGTDAFRAGAMRLRRLVMAGVAMLPHPVDLQWTALKSRGFSDEDRAALAGILAWHDASMASQTLTAAFAWMAFGAPDVGTET